MTMASKLELFRFALKRYLDEGDEGVDEAMKGDEGGDEGVGDEGVRYLHGIMPVWEEHRERQSGIWSTTSSTAPMGA